MGMLSVRTGVRNAIQSVQNVENAVFQMCIMKDMDTQNVQGNVYQDLRCVVTKVDRIAVVLDTFRVGMNAGEKHFDIMTV